MKTGSSPSAGTTARAYVSLQGSRGTVKRRRLLKGGGALEFVFLPGTTERFRMKGKDVGDLSHVTSEWVSVTIVMGGIGASKWSGLNDSAYMHASHIT